jgi:hypothetical protein
VEPRFHQRLQKHGHRRLRDPVRDRRHAEHSDPAPMRLGDLDNPDRRCKPGPRAHPIPDLVEVAPKIGLELGQVLPVHAVGALVGLDPPPRLPHQQLGNRKRLAFGLWQCSLASSRSQRPRLIDSSFRVSRPHRSTTTPESSGFPATTGRSASERRNRYSMPTVFYLGTLPLATLGACDPGRRIDARLLTFRARAADQDHAAYTPGTAWPTIGSPPSSSRRACNDPRFRCRLRNLRRFTSAHPTPRALMERLPDPHLTGSSPAFSPSLTTTVFSQRSTGWFGAAPEGRHRRASSPPSLAQLHLWKGSST